ncbi:DUF4405 domain-containing protein [Bythopirellula polymerisocia]|uniref:Flavinylation-associated cytochrome domain-containing protein n=1 Tax=Bythopirellula polymerisocia TaxID=2528003 RepID=A0A5C6CQM2_9BACT|nr:DUF4405 domain-containing protein [Bythopirellula polymerisocia]TWU25824.1 hypothetical protein Pla144_30360 [Bythopirellula polymerisocia]
MKRIHWNALVDGLALVAFVLLSSTGLLLSFQLPPGSGGREMLGMGHGAGEKSVTLLWGLTRHEWGDIHYWLSLSIMAILAVHLLLHWKWILCLFKPSGAHIYSGTRLALGAMGMLMLVVMAAAPYVTSTSQIPRADLQSSDTESEHAEEDLGIRGRMSLAEISAESGVPAKYLLRALQLPPETPLDSQAGRLLKDSGRDMADLREVIKKYVSDKQ